MAYVYTHYADPAGTDTWANATNIGTPCSFETARANASVGDVVGLRGGTYTLPPNTGDNYTPTTIFQNSGTAGNPIVFAAYTGESPLFNTTKVGATPIGANGNIGSTIFGVSDSSYITFDGIEFSCDNGTALARIILYSSNGTPFVDDTTWPTHDIQFLNCTFDGGNTQHAGGDNAAGLRVEYAKDILIKNCYFHDYSSTGNANTAAYKAYGGRNVIFENNHVHNCTIALNVKVANEGCHFRYNFFTGTGGIMNFYATTSGGGHNWIRDCHFYHNIAYEKTAFHMIMISDEQPATYGDITDCSIYNNTFYGTVNLFPHAGNTFKDTHTGGVASSGCAFYNNIFDIVGGDYGPADLYVYDSGSSIWTTFDYNLYRTGGIINVGGTLHTSIGSLQADSVPGLVSPNHDQNSLFGDPAYTNGNGDYSEPSDFALSGGSAGENAGSDSNDMGANVALVGLQAAAAGAPLINSVSIDAAGTTLTINMSEAVTVTDYTGFAISGHPMTGGAGSTTATLTRTITTPVTQLDSPLSLVYSDQGADTVEATTGGVDLASDPATPITNNSTVAVAPSWVTGTTANVNENETVLITLSATGYPTPTYSIDGAGNDNAFVEILDSATGAVTLKTGSALDYENPEATATANVYVIDVKASNASDATRTVTITVDNLAEAGAPTFQSGSIDPNGTNMIWTFEPEMLTGDNLGVYVTDINGDPITVDAVDVVVTGWGVAGAQPSAGVVHFTVAPPIPISTATYAKFVNSEGTLRNSEFQTHVEDFGPTAITNNSTVPASDTAAPYFTTQYPPTAFNITSTTAQLDPDLKINEGGTIYFVTVPFADSAPSIAQVIALTNAADGAPTDSGSQVVTANEPYTVITTGLTASTQYRIYAAAEDTAGNDVDFIGGPYTFTTDAVAGSAPTVTLTEYYPQENQNAVPVLEADETPTSWALTGSGTDNALFEFVTPANGILTLKNDASGNPINFDYEGAQNVYNITVTPENVHGATNEAAITITVLNTEVTITRPIPETTSLSYAFGSGGLAEDGAQISTFEQGYTGWDSVSHSPADATLTEANSPYTFTFVAAEAEDVVAVLTVTQDAKKNVVYVGSGVNATDSTGDGFEPTTPYATADAAKTFAIAQGASSVQFQDAGFHNTRVYIKRNAKLPVYDASGNLAGTSGEVTFGTGGTHANPSAAKIDALANSKKYVKCLTAGFYNTEIYVKANQTLPIITE